eukprot:CAMPEP_0115241464 /NCGR_PEP_ID=MMETSP0270-20121206/38443_1 /TAXON_ID=71861 /ORGANISM="Scrippsiella trochoidea, Strain CCMP3099" /LENGTH=161 /DNA_ID=CAMNT_0002656485 /DNA_START=102 /DNA_END=587 /DNA_ORIENTATION=+
MLSKGVQRSVPLQACGGECPVDCSPIFIQEGFKCGKLTERALAPALHLVSNQPEVPEAGVDAKAFSRVDPKGTRLVTCQALAEEALCGEAKAAVSIVEMLSDASSEVRHAAMEALTCIVDLGPRCTLDALAASLALSDPGMRWRSQEDVFMAAAIAARIGA